MYRPQDYLGKDPTWCPGCGNFPIRQVLADALVEAKLAPHHVLMVSGIGQAAKMPHYMQVNGFNGLHGRALPPAVGARIANPTLTVIVESGDGDTYGEGGNHFIHTIRRNPNIAHFVHNNQVYGLTKGQASPTSDIGMRTNAQPAGVFLEPFAPLAVALVMGAGFVARGFAGDKARLKELMLAAIAYPGYALVDILQPCVTFNKRNTYAWYKERGYYVEGHDTSDWDAALKLAREWGDRIPLGILYNVPRATFESHFPVLDGEPLALRPFAPAAVAKVQGEFV